MKKLVLILMSFCSISAYAGNGSSVLNQKIKTDFIEETNENFYNKTLGLMEQIELHQLNSQPFRNIEKCFLKAMVGDRDINPSECN